MAYHAPYEQRHLLDKLAYRKVRYVLQKMRCPNCLQLLTVDDWFLSHGHTVLYGHKTSAQLQYAWCAGKRC